MGNKSALKGKILPLSLMAASCGMYNILYLCVIFYVPFQSAFGYTNEQMGGLLAAYALVGTPLLFFDLRVMSPTSCQLLHPAICL